MNKEKPKRIVIHGCYSVSNSDLGIRDRKGRLMNGEHSVFVIKKSKDKKRVKVKTVTSLENISIDGVRSFHRSALDSVRRGEIIVIPNNVLKTNKLSGIHRRGIWISIDALYKSKYPFKFPKEYEAIISSDYR